MARLTQEEAKKHLKKIKNDIKNKNYIQLNTEKDVDDWFDNLIAEVESNKAKHD